MRITPEQYFGPYLEHKDVGHEEWFNAHVLLEKVDKLLELAESCGVPITTNLTTNSLVSGSGNGGFRPKKSTVGASKSRHKQGRAVDVYDPLNALDKWLVAQPDELLEDFGLWFEDGKHTNGWCHMQDIPPPSKRRFFIP